MVALIRGPDTDQVRNVDASGGCVLEKRSHVHRLDEPRVFRDEQRSVVPRWVRIPLRIMRVADFIEPSRVDSIPR